MMKSLLAVLMVRVILLLALSCATVPKEPIASGELRLLGMDAVGKDNVKGLMFSPSQIASRLRGDIILQRTETSLIC